MCIYCALITPYMFSISGLLNPQLVQSVDADPIDMEGWCKHEECTNQHKGSHEMNKARALAKQEKYEISDKGRRVMAVLNRWSRKGRQHCPKRPLHKEANPKPLPGGRDRQASGCIRREEPICWKGAMHTYTPCCSCSWRRPPDQHLSNLIEHEPSENPAK